ncbi:hypothetical protein [Nocardioides sp. YIM 152588]|uniref:hypothetical protein n=1 Tax=Nocardioides sp. YIM 152588 TaxID=3158259 RepID=UPI0032E51D37
MALPRIHATDDALGFHWRTPDDRPAPLADLFDLPGAEPHRWLPTHAEALDDVLVEVAGRFGEVLGGGRGARPGEHEGLASAYRAIDRAVADYAAAQRAAGLPADTRAGQIIGTAALLGIRARWVLGLTGPAPFDGSLDTPGVGMVGGHAGLHWAEDGAPWRGARWLVVTDDGRRLPATLSMLLHDSSGVAKDAALTEHRDALAAVTEAVVDPAGPPMTTFGEAPMVASGAVDWLLFDWVMAHRERTESGDSGAVVIPTGRVRDARLIVAAADASARVRARFDPGLLALPR